MTGSPGLTVGGHHMSVLDRPGPTDVVHPSALGRTRLARWEGLVAAQEAALARSLGEDRVGALMQALSELVDEGADDR